MSISGLSVAINATSEFFETVGNDLLAPWGGWQGFKLAVVCLFECSGPGDGSLGAQLAALGPIAAPVGEVNVVEEAAEGANVATRALTEADLGVAPGSLTTLEGTYSVTNGAATVQVNNIAGTIANPFSVISNLGATAAADGAQTLTIQGTIGNEQLFNILSGRYGLTSQGPLDTLTVPLGGQ